MFLCKSTKFQMKPDIVCRKQNNKDSKVLFIADTKWKILHSISEADLYQSLHI